MNSLKIQRGNPYSATIRITDSTVSPAAAYDLTDKYVLFTMKRPDDNVDNDNSAIIKKNITEHSAPAIAGITVLQLTAEETLKPVGIYKCDIRVYSSGIQINSTKFTAEIVDIITKRVL